MNKEQPYDYVKKAMRVATDRRAVKRPEPDRRMSNYDMSRRNIMYASYPRSIIDAQLKALESLK